MLHRRCDRTAGDVRDALPHLEGLHVALDAVVAMRPQPVGVLHADADVQAHEGREGGDVRRGATGGADHDEGVGVTSLIAAAVRVRPSIIWRGFSMGLQPGRAGRISQTAGVSMRPLRIRNRSAFETSASV
jgi:hypothetical protein